MIDRRVRLVRELKGAPLSAWMALIFAGPKPVNQSWLIRSTGCSDKPVRQALACLSEHGCIIRLQGGWLLLYAALRLLPGAPIETAPPEPAVEGHASSASPPASPPNSEANGQIGKKSLPPISIINNAFKDSLILNNTNRAGGKNSLPTREKFPNTSLFSDFPGPGAALQTFGIRQDRHPSDRVQAQHCAVQDPQIIAPRSAPPRRQRPAGFQPLAHPPGRAQGGANRAGVQTTTPWISPTPVRFQRTSRISRWFQPSQKRQPTPTFLHHTRTISSLPAP